MATQDMRGVRRSASSATGGVPAQVNQNEFDEMFFAQGMPAYTEMTRLGQGWSSMAIAAVAALVVRPTTVAAFEIWNGYSGASAPSLIVDDAFTFNLVASAIQGTFSLWAQVTAAKSAPSAGANVVVKGNSGKSYGGSVICGLGTTVIDTGWRPYGNSPAFGLGTATPGGVVSAPIQGKLIVPPGCSLCLHTVAQTTAWTFQNGASWYERLITNVA